jgi:hypothetical protein
VQYRIRRFGIQSTALTVGILYFLLAVLLVPILYLTTGGALAATVPPVMLVLIPFIYAVVGYIVAAIACWLYNIVAGWSGGVAFTLEPGEGG